MLMQITTFKFHPEKVLFEFKRVSFARTESCSSMADAFQGQPLPVAHLYSKYNSTYG